MKGSTKQPKIFISYSWTTPQHEQWVLDLAQRLAGDGIVVILDKWDLKEGQDKHVFMEQMVREETIDKVLVICDSGYQKKADDRKGGVGTEVQLISKEVYDDVGQQKFIPIIVERDSKGNICAPHFIESRIYIDLSSEDIYEQEYEKLLRNLFNKPLLRKPPLGTPPAYITDDEQLLLKTSHKVARIKNAISNNSKNTSGLVYDYLESLSSSLEDYRLDGGSHKDFDEKVIKSIDKMLPLRDDFIDFTNTIFKYNDNINLDTLHAFFEKLLSFQLRPKDVRTWSRVDFDNYNFFIYELMLYFFTVLFILRKYKEAAFFINSQYFITGPDTGELVNVGIEFFNQHVASLDEIRNKRLNLQRVSLTADFIKQRANRKDIQFAQIIQTDLILHYLTELQLSDFSWFPRCSVHGSRFSTQIELFGRMVSKSHFDKIKPLFSVNNKEELRLKLEKYKEQVNQQQSRRPDRFYYEIPFLENLIDIKKIGTLN